MKTLIEKLKALRLYFFSGSVNDDCAEQKRRELTDNYIENHCSNYTNKEKTIARNAVQIGWELRKHYR